MFIVIGVSICSELHLGIKLAINEYLMEWLNDWLGLDTSHRL